MGVEMSGMVAAFIVGGFTVLVATKNKQGRYVTEERKKWRDYIRAWMKDVTQIIYDGWDSNLLQAKKSEIILHLNPYDDTELKDEISELKLPKDNPNYADVLIEVRDMLQKLLKHDWERVKKNNSVLGSTVFINLSILSLVIYYVFRIKDYSDISDIIGAILEEKMIFSLFFIVLVKFLIVELEKLL